MWENFKLTEDTLYYLNNEEVEDFFKRFRISKWLWKDNNKFSLTIITDKEINEVGAFFIEKVWTWVNALYKYLIYKNPTTWFETADLSTDEALTKLNLDYNKGEMTIWQKIENEEMPVKLIDKWMHTAIFWITNSWKTVTLKFLLYQIAKYKYSEFILLWKWDLLALSDAKKVKYTNDVKSMQKSDFIALINYIWLNVADRSNKLSKLGYDWNYEEYKKSVMLKDPNAEQIPHLVLVIDEFESLRESIWAELKWWPEEFDTMLKSIANYVRAYGILMYFASQNYIKAEIGIMRDYTQNQLIGLSKNVQAQYVNTYPSNIKNAIAGTYLFYSTIENSFLKIPFDTPLEINKKIIQACKDNLLFEESYYKKYDHTYEMINDLIFKVDSDIFKYMENIYKSFHLWEYYHKVLKTPEFIPFSILIYAIFIMLKANNIGPNVNIYPSPNFKHKIDNDLYYNNKEFYNEKWKSLLLDGLKSLYKEGAADKEVFIDWVHDLLVSHINTIILNSDLTDVFWDEEKVEELEENEKKREENKELENWLLLNIIYTWEIKPVSFNSMYYIEKSQWDVKITNEAKQYEKTIKNKIANKLIATNISQTKWLVLLDIEFTLWVPVKKDWTLSKVWRNDLDNLLKATIDWIKNTIIADDDQVYGIRAKFHYIEKKSSFHKNNKVNIKVFELNKEVLNRYKNIFQNEQEITPLMNFTIWINSKINVPSANNMYFVNSEKTFSTTTNTIDYKQLLIWYIKEYKEIYKIWITKKDVLVYIEFHVPNSFDRDLDNMLKATIDAFSKEIVVDDKQILEIMTFKTELKEKDAYKAKIKIKFYEYNSIKNINIPIDEKTVDINPNLFDDEDININNDDTIRNNNIVSIEKFDSKNIDWKDINEFLEEDEILIDTQINNNNKIEENEILEDFNIKEDKGENISNNIDLYNKNIYIDNENDNIEENKNFDKLIEKNEKIIDLDEELEDANNNLIIENEKNWSNIKIIENNNIESNNIVSIKDIEIETFSIEDDDYDENEEEFNNKFNIEEDDVYDFEKESFKKKILD